MTEASKFQQIKSNNVFIQTFLPQNAPKAIIQINHGLAEHSFRYREFAEYLCNKGYGVYVHDHPGHGKTAGSLEKAGHLPWHQGWDDILDVLHNINKSIRKTHPGIPVFLMGHSMGSLLSRYYNATYPMYFKGMILSGTGNPDVATLKLSLTMVKVLHFFNKNTHKNKWLNSVFYKKFNQFVENPETKFDWLTSNKEEVEKYMNDPYCGFNLTLSFYKNLLQGSLQMLKSENNLKFRKNFATLIISGKQDPVGNFGKDPNTLYKKYIDQGYYNTHLKLIDGRHELLNEVQPIKHQAFEIIETWIDEKLQGNF